MNLADYSTQQLIELMQAISQELAARHSTPLIDRIKAAQPLIVMREPPEEDKNFVLHIKGRVTLGMYITADERGRVAEIAAEYGPWVVRQGLPTERGTGPWRKLLERSRVTPARER